MNQYQSKMKAFLQSAHATCEIKYGGISRNQNWKEKELRNWYDVTITTPRGTMNYVFWDSIYNTEISRMTPEKYAEQKLKRNYEDFNFHQMEKVQRELKKKKSESTPTEYDVITCLTMYDPGTFKDFCSEYGYDEDSKTAERVYIASIEEYKNIEKIFTKEQLEILRDIDDYELANELEIEM